jgi:ABC-type branched-subunit amino acid transport system permease subunit
MVVMCIVGGLGTVAGPVVGAIVIYYGLQVQLENYATLGTAITGAVMIALVRFAPDGIVGAIRSIPDHLIEWWRGLKSSTGPAAVAMEHETGVNG